ncbi:MAG: calcium-binding protein [Alphaproteobacteria bacterium]
MRHINSETPWARGVAGERYGLDTAGELIIRNSAGHDTYIANFKSGVSGGLTVGELSLEFYQLLKHPGGPNWFVEYFEVLFGQYLKAMTGQSYFTGVDPLVLDLDGDGLELTARSSVAPFYDIDGDGFGEQTGWVHGDDGLLAVDLNSNGIIDNIHELFGDAATSGFAELALADTNADNVIDANDWTFDYLRVWKDANSDAVTDAGELLTLDAAGIASINVIPTSTTPETIAGNIVTAKGSFTYTDQYVEEHGVDPASGLIGDVSFLANQRDTRWLGDDTIDEESYTLPEVKGYGTLTDLRIAMTDSQNLKTAVYNLLPSLNTLDIAAMRGALTPVLTEWMAATPVPAGTPGTLARSDVPIRADISLAGAEVYDYAYQVTDSQGTYWKQASGQPVRDAQNQIIPRPTLAEVLAQSATQGTWQTLSGTQVQFMERAIGTPVPFGEENLNGAASIAGAQGIIEYMWDGINKIAVRMAMQGPLAPFFDGIQYNVETDKFEATTERQIAPMLEAIFTATPSGQAAAVAYLDSWKPLLDMMLVDFDRGETYLKTTYAFLFQNVVAAYENVPVDATLVEASAALDIPASLIRTGTGTVVGGNDADLFYLSAGNQTLQGGAGPDSYIVGRDFGQDVIDDTENPLNGSPDMLRFAHLQSDEVSFARDGLDMVISVNGSTDELRILNQFTNPRKTATFSNLQSDHGVVEIVFANGEVWDRLDIAKAVSINTPGNDTLIGTNAVDFLDGGAGNDYLEGKQDGDVYGFGIGDGQDTILDEMHFIDIPGPDILQFKPGVAFDDLTFERNGNDNDLTVKITGTQDQITIQDQFVATYTGVYGTQWLTRIEGFVFDDGYSINWDRLMELMVARAKTPGNDIIYGFSWEDVLDGGADDDYLSGGNENDIYLFGLGYGNDTIEDDQVEPLSGGNDSLRFDAGITAQDVNLSRVGNSNNVTLTLQDSSSVTILGQFALNNLGTGAFDRIEQFEFADSTVWTYEDIQQMLLDQYSTSGNDSIYGFWREDTLDGGAGDDFLSGGDDNDTYLFGLGYGHDTIEDDKVSIFSGGDDTLRFGAGVTAQDVTLSRVGSSDDVTMTLQDNSSVTILGQFFLNTLGTGAFNRIEQFEFADSTVWTYDDIQQMLIDQSMTAGNDFIYGFNREDVFEGGLGDDYIEGGNEGDLYIFNRGDGDDTIYDIQGGFATGPLNNVDTLQFTDVNSTEITVSREINNTDMILTINNNGGSVRLKSQENTSTLGHRFYDIEQVKFADQATWTDEDIRLTYLQQASTAGNDYIIGFYSADTIHGGAGNDTIDGGSGHDMLYGDADDDIIIGGLGNDRITGGTGSDNLTGGMGADTFRFATLNDSLTSGYDTIEDFVQGTDLLDVSTLGFIGLESGSTPIADKLGTYISGGDTFVTDGNSFIFALDASITLTENDFIFS